MPFFVFYYDIYCKFYLILVQLQQLSFLSAWISALPLPFVCVYPSEVSLLWKAQMHLVVFVHWATYAFWLEIFFNTFKVIIDRCVLFWHFVNCFLVVLVPLCPLLLLVLSSFWFDDYLVVCLYSILIFFCIFSVSICFVVTMRLHTTFCEYKSLFQIYSNLHMNIVQSYILILLPILCFLMSHLTAFNCIYLLTICCSFTSFIFWPFY